MPQQPPTISRSIEPFHTFEEAQRFLEGLDVSAMKLGLSRIQAVLETLGNPQDGLPMVHLAGTNGKGSVTAILGSILKQAGYRVGSFTSPHLVHVRERIALNGNPILPDEFAYEVNALKSHLETIEWPADNWPTYFEFLNIMAYQYFQRKHADITLFETGLGGRLDSTNAVKHPNVSVITTIGMDHMQHLGNTLAQIAGEKAGILKRGTPLVLGEHIPEEAKAVILERAAQLEIPVAQADESLLSVDGTHSSLANGLHIQNQQNGHTYQLSLLGPYQKQNLATALACLQTLRNQGFAIEESAVQNGLQRASWPVRFQYFAQPHVVLDGSHNEDGFRSLAETLRLYCKDMPLLWLISLRNNRNPEPLFELIRQFGPPVGVITTQSQPTHLYHSAETLAHMLAEHLSADYFIEAIPNPAEAFRHLQHQQAEFPQQKPLALVTGSLYTAGAILIQLENK